MTSPDSSATAVFGPTGRLGEVGHPLGTFDRQLANLDGVESR